MAGAVVEGFTHDVLDRLVKVTRSGQVDELLEYAPTGEPLFRKLGTKGTWYVGSVATVTAEVPVSCTDTTTCVAVAGTVKVAAHVQVAGGRVASVKAAAGTGLDPVSEVLYYHRDMQGSVVATTYRTGGLSGALGARYRYTPYGQLDRAENVSPSSDSELGYTGGLRLGYAAGTAQQGNLVLLGARVYHAELKRWLVPDTVDGRRYTYTGGDPVNFVDPSGRTAIVVGGMRFTDRGFAQMYYDLFYGDSGSVGSWNLMVGELESDARIDLAVTHLTRLADFQALPMKTQRAILDILKTGGKYATEWAADYLKSSYQDPIVGVDGRPIDVSMMGPVKTPQGVAKAIGDKWLAPGLQGVMEGSWASLAGAMVATWAAKTGFSFESQADNWLYLKCSDMCNTLVENGMPQPFWSGAFLDCPAAAWTIMQTPGWNRKASP